MGTRDITFIDSSTGLPRIIQAEDADLFGVGVIGSRPASGDFAGDLWLLDDGSSNYRLQRWNGVSWADLTIQVSSGGSVDNAIARFDGTSGAILQNSQPTIDDSGNLTGVESLTLVSLASDPGSPTDGQVWYNTTDDQLRVRRNGVTEDLVGVSEIDFLEVNAAGDITTTSTTDVVATGMTITPGAGTYSVKFSTQLQSSTGGGQVFTTVYGNASAITNSQRQFIRTGIFGGNVRLTQVNTASVTVAASQAIDIRWRVNAGTGTMGNRSLTLQREAGS